MEQKWNPLFIVMVFLSTFCFAEDSTKVFSPFVSNTSVRSAISSVIFNGSTDVPATLDASNHTTFTCPLNSTLRLVANSCTAAVAHRCYAGEFQSGLSCWCAGSANNCCNSAFGNCNYTETPSVCTYTATCAYYKLTWQ